MRVVSRSFFLGRLEVLVVVLFGGGGGGKVPNFVDIQTNR